MLVETMPTLSHADTATVDISWGMQLQQLPTKQVASLFTNGSESPTPGVEKDSDGSAEAFDALLSEWDDDFPVLSLWPSG